MKSIIMVNMETKNKDAHGQSWRIASLAVATLLLCLTTFRYWMEVKLGLRDTFDYGIYQKTMFEIASGNSLNPFIGFRGLKAFNDHFDPIQILMAPITRLFGYHVSSPLLIEILFVLITLYILAKILYKKVPTINFLLVITIFTFSRGLLSAINYPIHPTTWAILPIFGIVYSIVNKKDKLLIFSCFSFCLFKEVFPFAVIGLSFYYLLTSQRKMGFTLLGIGLSFVIFVFKIKQFFMGPHYNHAEIVSFSVADVFLHFPYSDYFKILLPVAIPWALMLKKHLKFKETFFKSDFYPTFFFYSPLFLIHFLSHHSFFQYGILMAMPILFWTFLRIELIDFSKLSKPLIVLMFALAIAPGTGFYTKNVKKIPRYLSHEKPKDFTRLLDENTTSQDKIFATAGLAISHMKPGRNFYEINRFTNPDINYDFIFLDTGFKTFVNYYSPDKLQQIKNCCLNYVEKVIYDQEGVILAKGQFPKACFQ